jgi:hypothetical protein
MVILDTSAVRSYLVEVGVAEAQAQEAALGGDQEEFDVG